MKLFLAALIGCLYLATVQATKLEEEEGFYTEIRPRLGHFKEEPFIDLYKFYAVAFVKPNHPDRVNQDYRNYLPSGDECLVFLQSFRINKYKLKDIEEFIILDACLGYLHESTYHDDDKEQSESLRTKLQGWIDDEKLKSIYEGTEINTFSEVGKDCTSDLLGKSIMAKAQFKGIVCNNEWLQIFIDFAECQHELPADKRESDTYLNMLYNLVRERGRKCFDHEIHLLNKAVRSEYINNPWHRLGNTLTEKGRETNERMWPIEFKRLFTAVQNAKKINLREINGIIRGIGQNKDNFRERLLNNLAVYANQKIRTRSKSALQWDPTGAQRYTKMIDDLCNFFRKPTDQNFYDFTTPFMRMIKMLKHPEIFELTVKDFQNKVIKHSYESAPIYFGVSSCNLLSYTEAAFETVPQNHKNKYTVEFMPDTSGMLQWPDAGFY